jgi:hypothetical protein
VVRVVSSHHHKALHRVSPDRILAAVDMSGSARWWPVWHGKVRRVTRTMLRGSRRERVGRSKSRWTSRDTAFVARRANSCSHQTCRATCMCLVVRVSSSYHSTKSLALFDLWPCSCLHLLLSYLFAFCVLWCLAFSLSNDVGLRSCFFRAF